MSTHTRITRLLAAVVASAMLCTGVEQAYGGDAVAVTLADGSEWSGELGQEIRVTYSQRGIRRTAIGTIVRVDKGWLQLSSNGRRLSPIRVGEVVSIEAVGGAPATDPTPAESEPATGDEGGDDGSSEPSDTQASDGGGDPADEEAADDSDIRPTFILPLTGMVGEAFRAEEIEAIVAQADELGPGQTIVLDINSGGGIVAEWMMVRDAIYDAQKRHRVVAWVLDGTSAACSTSLCCDVIVMRSRGHLGSITTLFGGPSGPLAYQVQAAKDHLEPVLRQSGRSPKLAVPFKTGDHPTLSLLSYTKNPETGDVTWFQSLEGEVDMNRPGQVLGFDARQAVDCGLAIGIADDEEELGLLLDQGGWNEVGTGRDLHEDWNALVDRSKKYLRLSSKEYQEAGRGEEGLRKRIAIVENWIRWYDRAPNPVALAMQNMGFQGKADIERLLLQLREELREIQESKRR